MHVCIYAYIHWLSYLRTYIPLYPHTSIPLYLHTFIPIFIPLYLRTCIHTLHCTALHYSTLHYLHVWIRAYIHCWWMHALRLHRYTGYMDGLCKFGRIRCRNKFGISWDLTISYKKDLWPIYSLALCPCKHYMNQSYMLIHPYPKSYSLYKCILDPYALMPINFWLVVSTATRTVNRYGQCAYTYIYIGIQILHMGVSEYRGCCN